MTEQYRLGQKIRFFRKRSSLSQMELENAIGMSPGSISRIENGETNPTKETLDKLRTILKLSSKEYRYLSGDLVEESTINEINEAVSEVQKYFAEKGRLAYLLDDKSRMWLLSDGFMKSFKMSKEFFEENLKGKSLVEITLNPELVVQKFLEGNNYEDIVKKVLMRFKLEVGYMVNEQIYKDIEQIINHFTISRKLWEEIDRMDVTELNFGTARTVTFNFMGLPINMNYSLENLKSNDRFQIVEYIPTNRFIKFLSKL